MPVQNRLNTFLLYFPKVPLDPEIVVLFYCPTDHWRPPEQVNPKTSHHNEVFRVTPTRIPPDCKHVLYIDCN